MSKQVPRSISEKAIDRLFGMMEQAIRLNTYEADDLLFMVADLIPANPILAAAISKHAADFIHEDSIEGETSWTDIVVEAYRRALFDVEKSQLYGTDYFLGNLPAMENFVTNYIREHTLGSDNAPNETATATAH